jgi:hypothetical protein
MVFENSHARTFEVPKKWLEEGVHYEFRMAYPFSSYTYRTNSLVVKTFDSTSPYVSSVVWSSTHERIYIDWEAPEYSEGLIGYRVNVSYLIEGNGDVLHPHWSTSDLTVVGHADLSLTSTSATIGCHVDSAAITVCLFGYTMYYVEISVIRESGVDAPRTFYVVTTLLERSAFDHSEIYIYTGDIFVMFVDEAEWMVSGMMAIGDTPFARARIESPSKDLVVELHNSTVVQTSPREFKIEMSYDEYHMMLTLIDRFEFTFTSLSLVYGAEQNSMPLLEFCK